MPPEKPDESRLFRLKWKMRELFPPTERETSRMVRLAILRDDIQEERTRMITRPTGTAHERVWAAIYVLRQVTVSVGEVRAIFQDGVLRRNVPADVGPLFQQGVSGVDEAYKVLEPIRNGLGGHVRPKNAVPADRKGDPILDAIRVHGDEECEVQIDTATGQYTDLRGFTSHALLLIYPELKTAEDLVAKLDQIYAELGKCLIQIVHAIDALLYIFWKRLADQRR